MVAPTCCSRCIPQDARYRQACGSATMCVGSHCGWRLAGGAVPFSCVVQPEIRRRTSEHLDCHRLNLLSVCHAGGCRTSAGVWGRRTRRRWSRCCSAPPARCAPAPCSSATAPRRCDRRPLALAIPCVAVLPRVQRCVLVPELTAVARALLTPRLLLRRTSPGHEWHSQIATSTMRNPQCILQGYDHGR